MPDPLFPALHIRPARGWLNDPNGLCRIDGRWHVFFQHNPDAPVHDAIAWGHVSSTDLLTWREHPVALRPRPGGPDQAGCWSGCLVDDDGVPTIVYTANPGDAADATVSLATSDRSLEVWQQRRDEVVGTPVHPLVTEARDPFVFDLDGHRYAVQGCGRPQPTGAPVIMAYRCDDLEQWTELGPLLEADDPVAAEVAAADIWECPGLVRLGDGWLLVLSIWRADGNSGTLAGVRWLTGELHTDHDRLRFVPDRGGVFDHGPAYYAPQLLVTDDRVLCWGWAWELDRSPEQVAEAGWAGALTWPRELMITEDAVVGRPVAELEALRSADLGTVAEIDEHAFEVVADEPVELSLVRGDDHLVVITADDLGAGPVRIMVDGSMVEAFGTQRSFTTRAYPEPGAGWRLSRPSQTYRLGFA